MKKLVPTIGIETHVQLKTRTKLFSPVSNDAREAKPNTLVSPICFGLPGILPVLNKEAIRLAIKAGIVLNAHIAEFTKFDRKHYFYPDLPKGYQITQFDHPIVGEGFLEVSVGGLKKKIHIERAHLEEDAGKSTHPTGADYTLVDLNRAGTPLLEIVSKPDMHSPAEAKAYVKELYLAMKYADISDADLYHGNMRFDVNISLSPEGSKSLGVRAEIKNLNSFRSVERACEYEIKRQTEILTKGDKVIQETRGWDEAKQKTISQRGKEEAHDYRYFPEPDIPPLKISKELIIDEKKNTKLISEIRDTLSNGISESLIDTLLEHPEVTNFMMEYSKKLTASHNKDIARKKLAFIGNLFSTVWLSKQTEKFYIDATQADELYELISKGQISSTGAKTIFLEIASQRYEGSVEELSSEMGLVQLSDQDEMSNIVEKVIKDNEAAVMDYKSGEVKAMGFLVGQVMKESKGAANPQYAAELIKKRLS